MNSRSSRSLALPLALGIASAIALVLLATGPALAADGGTDSGINDSGVTTVPSEGGKFVDATTTTSSGDPTPPVEDEGGCAVSTRGADDGWAAIGVLVTASLGVILRARRRRK